MSTTEIDILITKVLAGEADTEELDALEQWRKAETNNNHHFLELETIWKKASTQTLQVDVDVAWDKVKNRLTANHPKQTHMFELSVWVQSAAAVFILGVLTWLGYTRLYNPMVVHQTAANVQKEITLPDGSTVWLNESSTLSYAKQLNGNHRNIHLDGEAFFDVVKKPEQPFVISSNRSEVTVLGTSFTITDRTEQAEVQLHVATGKVRFLSPQTHKEVFVTAGNKAVIGTDGMPQLNGEVSVNDMAWKTRKLVFENAPLDKVFADLETYFKVKFVVKEPAIYNCHFTGAFNQPKLEQILTILDKALSLSHTQKGKTITVSGKGCEL